MTIAVKNELTMAGGRCVITPFQVVVPHQGMPGVSRGAFSISLISAGHAPPVAARDVAVTSVTRLVVVVVFANAGTDTVVPRSLASVPINYTNISTQSKQLMKILDF